MMSAYKIKQMKIKGLTQAEEYNSPQLQGNSQSPGV